MPEYALKCPGCGTRFETFEHHTKRYEIACPACKHTPVETDFDKTKVRNGNRVFGSSESISLTHFCEPGTADEMNREVGVNNYRDNGDVVFADRQDERAFKKKEAAWKAGRLKALEPQWEAERLADAKARAKAAAEPS